MKKTKILPAIYFLMGLLTIFLIVLVFKKEPSVNPTLANYTLKYMDDKSLLITSAGQSTDTYILQDTVNELRFHNLFMPQATVIDIDTTRAILVVVGYSEVGMKLHNKNFEDEYTRIEALIQQAEKTKIPIVAIYVGGKERRSAETDQLLELVVPQSNLVIATYSGNKDRKISGMANRYGIPISLINQSMDMTEPLASVFR